MKITSERVPVKEFATRTTEGGKGDRPRPVNQERYAQNYDRIFRKGKQNA